MATLFVKGSERQGRMLQVVIPGRGRKTIRLGRLSDRAAERFRDRVEELESGLRLNQPPSPEMAAWLSGLTQDVYDKLAAIGLVEQRAPASAIPCLGTFLDKYIASKRGSVAPRSIQLLEQTKARLLAEFGAATPIDKIGPDGALDWRAGMLDAGLSEATVRLHTRNAKSMFNDAVERELIDRSPFRKLPSAAVAAEREQYISPEITERIMAHLPDHQWRLLLGLARYGGLRVPSETHRLEWTHVDWDRARLTVFAPKTGATRVVPIVPRLMELLKIAHREREPGFEQMLLLTENNLHRTVHRAIAAAGLEAWPDLFQNLRRNAETDFAASGSPAHAVAAFMGHSVAVSRRHYLQVTDAMLDAAAGLNEHSALQNALQHRHAQGRTGAQKAKPGEPGASADAA